MSTAWLSWKTIPYMIQYESIWNQIVFLNHRSLLLSVQLWLTWFWCQTHLWMNSISRNTDHQEKVSLDFFQLWETAEKQGELVLYTRMLFSLPHFIYNCMLLFCFVFYNYCYWTEPDTNYVTFMLSSWIPCPMQFYLGPDFLIHTFMLTDLSGILTSIICLKYCSFHAAGGVTVS